MLSFNLAAAVFGLLTLGNAEVAIRGSNSGRRLGIQFIANRKDSCPKGNVETQTYLLQCEGTAKVTAKRQNCEETRIRILREILIYLFQTNAQRPKIEDVVQSKPSVISSAVSRLFEGWYDYGDAEAKKFNFIVYNMMVSALPELKDYETLYKGLNVHIAHPKFLYELARFVLHGCPSS